VLIIGAGIVGLSTAYHIKENNPSLSVLVIDRSAAPGQGDTAKSVAAIRDIFTSEVNRLLASSSIDFYKHIQSQIGFNLDLEMIGYLWLLSESQFTAFEELERRVRKQGTRLKVIERKELTDHIPDLVLKPSSEQSKIIGLEGVHKALLGLNCGTVSPELIVKFYEDQIKRLGGEFQMGTEVKSLRIEAKNRLDLPGEPYVWQDKLFRGVETNRGFISADTLVIATGTGTPFLLDPIGIDCLVKPKKRQVFRIIGSGLERLLGTKGFNQQNTIPFTILPKGRVYFRPVQREKSIWVGAADDIGRPFFFEEEPSAEESYYTYNINPILSEYFPCFANLRPVSSWAGLYDINSIDSIPVVDRIGNCILAAGLSGSGIMKADAVGRMAAAIFEGKEEAEFFGDRRISTSQLGLTNRALAKEEFVI
jgi:glycine/D-amino acid oxidase-like deaminating enzyme